MTTTNGGWMWRWPVALGLAIGGGLAHASDSDGSSSFNGAFLTLSTDVANGHLIFRSFKVTPATAESFVGACSHHKRIWIDSVAVPCATGTAIEHGTAVQVEIPQDAGKAISAAGYFVVSAKPISWLALRGPNEQERVAMAGAAGTAAAAAAGLHLTAAELGHAKAVSGKDRALVLLVHGKDGNGNRPTYVFSITGYQVAYAGKLPDWPERLLEIDGAPQAVVNLHGEALIIKVLSLWPRVESQMFAGEGG